MKIYKIRDWAALFENNRSRTVIELSWVPIPNRHDGENFSLIMAQPDGAKIFSAWILMLQVASRCQPRGTLVRDNKIPHNADSLAMKTRAPKEWFDLGLNFLENNTDWLEIVDNWQATASVMAPPCQETDPSRARAEWNGMEGKEGKEWNGREVEKVLDPPLVRLMASLNAAYQRSSKQAWNYSDEQAAVDLLKRENWEPDLEVVLAHRRKLSPDERRFYSPSVFSCLSKFDEWLDKARAQKAAPIKSTPPQKVNGTPQDEVTLKKMAAQLAAHRKELR